jgi:hypothetical protein
MACFSTQSSKQGKKPRRKVKLRSATFEDHDQQLESRYWPEARNDAGGHLGLQKEWQIEWVVEDENQRVVRSVGAGVPRGPLTGVVRRPRNSSRKRHGTPVR